MNKKFFFVLLAALLGLLISCSKPGSLPAQNPSVPGEPMNASDSQLPDESAQPASDAARPDSTPGPGAAMGNNYPNEDEQQGDNQGQFPGGGQSDMGQNPNGGPSHKGADPNGAGQPGDKKTVPNASSQPFKVLSVRNLELDKKLLDPKSFQLIAPQFKMVQQKAYQQAAQSCLTLIADPKQTIPAREAACRLFILLPLQYWGASHQVITGKLLFIGPLEGTAQAQKLKIKPDKGKDLEIATSTFTSRVTKDLKLGENVEISVYPFDFLLIKPAVK